MKKIFRLTPSIIGFAYAVFLGMFAFDTPFGIGLFIHLIPAFLVITACLIGFKSALGGGISTAVLAVAFTLFFHAYKWLLIFEVIVAPLILVSLLYFISACLEKPPVKT